MTYGSAHSHTALTWLGGISGTFRNAYRFMCLFDRSDRTLALRGLSRAQLVDSYLDSFKHA